ncbi:MAG: DUF4349 domain-containing protein, partial [Spirochaetota bacterium]|nr:DUF4349 domain-containing protein [Spirochaetota bacterium]
NLINEGVNLETSESSKTTNKKKLDRLTIYRAYYTLLVASVKDSVNYIKELIKKYAGFIDNLSTSDSYRQAYIVLKIPVKHFEQVIAEIAMIGIVEQKNISAADVTEEYYDTMLRIESSKRILYRLQDLLKRANKPKERIKILKEIERVSSQIEIMEERTKYLRSQADYSTITITLKTQIREDVKKYIPSPFNWIRLMEANNYPNYDVRRDFNYTKPEGFFTLEDKYKLRKVPYLLMSPGDEVKIRLGYVDNYPEANQKFWSEALNVDIENRKYQLIKKIDISSSEISFSGGVYRISHDSIYFIAIAVKDNDILIAEGIFKNEKIYKENDIKLDKFLKSVRW